MKPIVDYLFEETKRVAVMEKDKYLYMDDLTVVGDELIALAKGRQSLDMESERVSKINKQAREEIEKEYPIYKQLNITNLLTPYTVEHYNEMKTFIDGIRKIANDSIDNKIETDVIDWKIKRLNQH